MKVVEFTGIPGSGKSTALPLLRQLLRSANRVVYEYDDLKVLYFRRKLPLLGWIFHIPGGLRILKKMFYFLKINALYRQKFRNRYATLHQFVATVLEKYRLEPHIKDILWSWVNVTGVTRCLAEDLLLEDEVLILSEGFIHITQNIFVYPSEDSVDKESLIRFVGYCPDVDLIIAVHSDPKRSLQAALHPGNQKKRLLNSTKKEKELFYINAKEVFEATLETVRNSHRTLFELDNKENLDPADPLTSSLSTQLKIALQEF